MANDRYSGTAWRQHGRLDGKGQRRARATQDNQNNYNIK